MNFHHTAQSNEGLHSRGVGIDSQNLFEDAMREFERISPASPLNNNTRSHFQHHLASNLLSSSFRSNTSSSGEYSGRSLHLSEPESNLDDDMIHELIEFVRANKQ